MLGTPAFGELGQKDCHQSEVYLNSTVSSRPAQVTARDPVTKEKQRTQGAGGCLGPVKAPDTPGLVVRASRTTRN